MEPFFEHLALNYHHLRYFWLVARDGQLSRAARQARVAPSALSTQIHQLEDQLGVALFVREGRTLALTEEGRVVLRAAELIFGAGEELLSTLRTGRGAHEVLRVGAASTLSRNFQESFLRPLLRDLRTPLQLVAGQLDALLDQLATLQLDVVLANHAPAASPERPLRAIRLARQAVSLIGHADAPPLRFPEDLDGLALVLPGPSSPLRAAFDALCARHRVTPRVLAEVDDMALLRLIARDAEAVALVPPVVVRDELADGRLRELVALPELYEAFYAITLPRRLPHPTLDALLARGADELLG